MKSTHNGSLRECRPAAGQPCPANTYFPVQSPSRPVTHTKPGAGQIEAEIIQLMKDCGSDLARYAKAMTRERTLVQDGVQEAFLRYFIARTGGQHIKNSRAWLFRVLRNYLLDCRRRSGFESAVDLESAMDIKDLKQDVAAGYEHGESFRCALSTLSPRERECMRLRLEGFGYEEIACALRIRPGTVASLLARGLKKIRHSEASSGK